MAEPPHEHPASDTPGPTPTPGPAARPLNFIEQIIEQDIAHARWGLTGTTGLGTPRGVHTRFPPEPNGYLHIGHAKSICLNYSLAKKYHGRFNLRFDDTNPSKEEQRYVDGIKADVSWLTEPLGGGFAHGPHAGGLFLASSYFEQMEEFAKELIKKGKAYACQLTADEVAARRGTPAVPATSPYRDRPPEESMRLFREMKAGKHPDGSLTLRARIDLASPNFNLRDPVMYRVLHAHHHSTADKWCIYPMYDWAHGIEDSLEQITHSICTLEFENHRPLYDWFIDAINEGRTPDGSGPWGTTIWHSRQVEFAKLQLTYTVLSKRNLLKMVQTGAVAGWDDPRMPTLCGIRRRGVPPEAIHLLCEDVGVTKFDSVIDIARFENATRTVLNKSAPRAMCVLDPLRVVIDNWPAGRVEDVEFVINPEDPSSGKRTLPFTGELFIEREDFMPEPSKGFHRLAPGAQVRLRWAYFITCTGFETGPDGKVNLVRCTYDPATRGGNAPPGADALTNKKVKGTLHWISAHHTITGHVRLFDRLFNAEAPGERTGNWADDLTPDSIKVCTGCKLDPILADAPVGQAFQFERLGYFTIDPDSRPGALLLNRTITLKESTPEKPKAAVRTYTPAEAAHELKIKQDKLPALIDAAGPAGFAERNPHHLTLDEVRALRQWLKANPPAKG
ncbi:MAG: glutamine--tRNA ligase/YqeY domain fusion protein [Phycisphaeraceae bacterium]|nr:glutamine--tRNA ligase/YqeY domain fusion protein [Phycisphaeraceae bacterium]